MFGRREIRKMRKKRSVPRHNRPRPASLDDQRGGGSRSGVVEVARFDSDVSLNDDSMPRIAVISGTTMDDPPSLQEDASPSKGQRRYSQQQEVEDGERHWWSARTRLATADKWRAEAARKADQQL